MKNKLGLKLAAVPLLVAASIFVGVAGASAAPTSPDSVGVPQTAYFGNSPSACRSTQSLYESEYAHILRSCYDSNAGLLEDLGQLQPNWAFDYQWT